MVVVDSRTPLLRHHRLSWQTSSFVPDIRSSPSPNLGKQDCAFRTTASQTVLEISLSDKRSSAYATTHTNRYSQNVPMEDDDNGTATSAQPSSPKLYYVKDARANAVPQQLTGSHDLMTTFNLLPLYNQYVKQKLENNEDVPPIEPTYFPFISDLPGKNVIRPGNYIRALLEAPEKGYGPIHSFSASTLRDAFTQYLAQRRRPCIEMCQKSLQRYHQQQQQIHSNPIPAM
ncbi:hypothetical protein BGZ67_001251 [Mortierella alpina]|nr:hypothetical protein BGZ67_001251 [Mortierella alpina]